MYCFMILPTAYLQMKDWDSEAQDLAQSSAAGKSRTGDLTVFGSSCSPKACVVYLKKPRQYSPFFLKLTLEDTEFFFDKA